MSSIRVQGRTALHMAADAGLIGVVDALIKGGAKVSLRDAQASLACTTLCLVYHHMFNVLPHVQCMTSCSLSCHAICSEHMSVHSSDEANMSLNSDQAVPHALLFPSEVVEMFS